MAATTTVRSSVDFLLHAGGSSIGFGTGGTLTLNQALNDSSSDAATNWQVRTAGARSWSLQADGIINESGTILTGHDSGGTPLSVTIGGTALKGITSAEVALSCDVAEVVNSTTGLDRALDSAARSLSLTIQGDYYDPLGTGAGALDDILDELLGTTTAGLATVLTVGGVSLTFTARPTTASVVKSAGDILKNGLTLVSTGAVTNGTTGLDTGTSALLTAFFTTAAAGSVTVLCSGADDSGNAEYTGSAIPSAINISVPYAGNATVSATLEGTGALTKQADAA